MIDAGRIIKVALWHNPTRLQIELDNENEPPIGVYGEGAETDAENLDTLRDEHQLHFLVFRDGAQS